MVPNLVLEHKGCLFAPRCDNAGDECHNGEPPVYADKDGMAFCFRRLHYND
jgi:ABC-type dipeptide/oligopeptide/nickel transport system ATPase component